VGFIGFAVLGIKPGFFKRLIFMFLGFLFVLSYPTNRICTLKVNKVGSVKYLL